MTRQNKRRPLLMISGGVAAGGGGGLLLVSRGTDAVSHIWLPPEVIADAGYAAIAAGALAFVVRMLSWLLLIFQEQKAEALRLAQEKKAEALRLAQEEKAESLRLSQEEEAGQKMVATASTFEEIEKAYLHIITRSHSSEGDRDVPANGDQGPSAGAGPLADSRA